jgi:peptide chain release factor
MSMDVFLHVTSGNGPVECRIAVGLMTNQIVLEAADKGIDAEVSQGPSPDRHGPKSSVVHLSGEAAQAVASRFEGTIRFVFKSPVRKGHARQNWFVGVSRIHDPAAVEADVIAPEDVRFETLRAGGPGGQHVNTTDSAVRVVDQPTGIAVQYPHPR